MDKKAFEMKERTANIMKEGTRALGSSIVGQFNPQFSTATTAAEDEPETRTDMARVFTATELANLTLHQVRERR